MEEEDGFWGAWHTTENFLYMATNPCWCWCIRTEKVQMLYYDKVCFAAYETAKFAVDCDSISHVYPVPEPMVEWVHYVDGDGRHRLVADVGDV